MYFDPGTGSLIIQAIVAILAVAGGYLAVFKTRLKNIFKKKDKTESGEQKTEENNASEENDDNL